MCTEIHPRVSETTKRTVPNLTLLGFYNRAYIKFVIYYAYF